MSDESPGDMADKSIIQEGSEKATSGPTKEKIPSTKLVEILSNEQYMKVLRPLIAAAVLKASLIPGLMDDITKLFENKANPELTEALTTLQNKLQSIYEDKEPRSISEGGRKRRRTNKRKNYKKRRSTKHR